MSLEDRSRVSECIRKELVERGWSLADLASRMGRGKSAVVNLISGDNASRSSRLRLEIAMKKAFWSSPAEVAALLPVAAYFGGQHPRTLNLRGLDALAVKYLRPAGLRGRIRPRAMLVERLETLATSTSQA